jgi:peptidylprolyl isomerase
MGTEKRERQKAGRVARAEAARVAERKAANRRRLTTVVALAAVAALLVGIYAWRSGSDEETASTTTSTPQQTTTTPPVDAVPAGTPCVPLAGPLPAGSPEFTIPEGVPSGELVIEDLVVGDGDTVTPGAEVTINYVGVSCSTGEIFDDSYSRGQPATFPLDGLIAGWQEGIPGMQVGGQRLLVIPPDLGYGPTGRPGSIRGNETLIFLVEVLGTTPA